MEICPRGVIGTYTRYVGSMADYIGPAISPETPVIAVGDVVCRNFEAYFGFPATIQVIDGVASGEPVEYPEPTEIVYNSPNAVSPDLNEALFGAIRAMPTRSTILVIGEEDIAFELASLYAPDGTVIMCGNRKSKSLGYHIAGKISRARATINLINPHYDKGEVHYE